MNTVIKGTRTASRKYTLRQLCDIVHKETAFIGECGSGPPDSLYLISFGTIILASNPKITWSNNPDIFINRFVDIEISIIEKK